MPLLNNRTNRVALLTTEANTATVASLNAVSETVTSAKINKIWWTGQWTVARGANTVFTSPAGSSGEWILSDEGVSIDLDTTATIVSTPTGDGTIILFLDKND